MSTDRDDEPPHRTRIGATTDSIALIASVNGRGVILAYDGPGIEADIEAIGSRYLDDLGLDDAPDGLSIWEGHLSTYGEYDAELCGSFRALTDAEWARLRETGTPWEYDELAACDPSPEPKFQPSTIDPHAWTVVDSYERADGSRTWRAMGPWRATRKEAERDAEHGSMLGALPEDAVQRVRDLERERDAALARVAELEEALREIAAIDSASPEHRIAMRALGDSPAVSTPRLRRDAAGARCHRCGHYETSYDRAESLYAHCPSCSRHTRWERVEDAPPKEGPDDSDESDIIAAGRRGDS